MNATSGTAIVCDGIGGQPGSEWAAYLTARVVAENFSTIPHFASDRVARKAVENLLYAAHQEVNTKNAELRRTNPSSDIGTTAVVAQLYLEPDGRELVPMVAGAHCGDSRMYLARPKRERPGDLRLLQLTLDHGIFAAANAQEAWQAQGILANVTRADELPDRYIDDWKYRHLLATNIGGSSRPDIATQPLRVYQGDRLLLTSDGIHDFLTDHEIEAVINKYRDNPAAACRALVKAAQARSYQLDHFRVHGLGEERFGGKVADDMTAVMLMAG